MGTRGTGHNTGIIGRILSITEHVVVKMAASSSAPLASNSSGSYVLTTHAAAVMVKILRHG